MNCPLCLSSKNSLRQKIKDFDYHTCHECGVVFLSPFPTVEELEKWYKNEEYFTQETGNTGYVDYISLQDGLKKTFMRRNKFLGDKSWWQSRKVLEIGCALGFYPEVLRSYSNIEYTGIDLNGYAVKKTQEKGFKGLTGDIRIIQERNYYDVVVFFDVIEHVIHPAAFLKEINLRLRKGGKVFLTTPCTSSLLARFSGSKWISYIVPHHVLLYHPERMRRLMESCGFEKVRVHTDIQWVPLSFLSDRLSRFIPPLQRAAVILKEKEKQGTPILIPVLNGNMLVSASKK